MVSPVHGDYRRCQAKTPLIDLFKFAEPALYPPTRHLAVKVRLFIDFLVERFSAGPEAGIGRSSTMDA
jgi:hypothetical protein